MRGILAFIVGMCVLRWLIVQWEAVTGWPAVMLLLPNVWLILACAAFPLIVAAVYGVGVFRFYIHPAWVRFGGWPRAIAWGLYAYIAWFIYIGFIAS